MQQQQQQMPMMGSTMAPAPITTDQIQKYLDENKQLILAILDNQNLGKLSECAQYQAQLQKNLLYLAAIADSQPPTTIRPQMIPQAGMHQGGGQLMQQAPIFRPQSPLQFNPHDVQQQQQLHHQMPFPGHMGMRPVGVMNGMNAESSRRGTNSEVPQGGRNLPESSRGSTPNSSANGRESKRDAGAAAASELLPPAAADGQKSAAAENASGEADPKRPEGTETP